MEKKKFKLDSIKASLYTKDELSQFYGGATSNPNSGNSHDTNDNECSTMNDNDEGDCEDHDENSNPLADWIMTEAAIDHCPPPSGGITGPTPDPGGFRPA